MIFRAGFRCAVTVLFLLRLSTTSDAADGKLDVVILGGRIVDGTGAPSYVADLGIADGRIARIGRLTDVNADVVIDGT